jgi:two-component system sensor histidine kinase SenX3
LGRALPLAEKKEIRIESEDTAGLALEGDRELMEYALYNLITNAVKYSPAGTQVRVGARRNGRDLELSVRDQGIGLSEEERGKLFRKFYRTEKAEKSGEMGTGLGLSIVQQIVARHGGRIDVASAPGQGSCFTIVLPASQTVH